jgi:LasA protease
MDGIGCFKNFCSLVASKLTSLLVLFVLLLAACERPDPEIALAPSAAAPQFPAAAGADETVLERIALGPPPTPLVYPPVGDPLPVYLGTPTPDSPRVMGAGGSGDGEFLMHTVDVGETLSQIAQLYGSTIEELTTANDLINANIIAVGQILLIPGKVTVTGPGFKIIPDSELVYGPAAKGFDVYAAVAGYNGYLLRHSEEVEERLLSGPEIVQLVADRFSVNPRLLLAVLEHRSGWVTQGLVLDDGYPLGYVAPGASGLYKQLSWAANLLNWGLYGRAEGGLQTTVIKDGTRIAFAPEINDGTAGVQKWLAAHSDATYSGWLEETGLHGFFATYSRLFGNPFAYAIEPIWPANLSQPALRLPWSPGETWYFTGGPHGGWASGSGWAALDFVPHSQQLGCYPSDAWVTAMAPGLVVRSDFGAVVVDLDGDGYAGTGWALSYMHVESRNRVPVGTYVQTGDPLGHASCEGGFSNGTHVHIARTYNGRWVSADGVIPFNLGGWVSRGGGREYNGFLVRGDVIKEACQCRAEKNALTAD